MEAIILSIIRSDQSASALYWLSIGYGAAHVVIRLKNKEVISEIIDLVSQHKGEPKAYWLKIGIFGPYEATLYLNKNFLNIIIDGDECGDGSIQSFGFHLPISRVAEFLELLSSKWAEIMQQYQ